MKLVNVPKDLDHYLVYVEGLIKVCFSNDCHSLMPGI
jgi:hypothetical protein